jgi:hypothetical protein
MNDTSAFSDELNRLSKPVMESCENCRYALPMATGRYRCRANPPIAGIVHDSWDPTRPDHPPKMLSFFPSVQAFDWCGHWEPEREHETRTLGVGPVAAPLADEEKDAGPETKPEGEVNDDTRPVAPESEDPAEKRKREADAAAGSAMETPNAPLEEIPSGGPPGFQKRLAKKK